MKHVTVKINLIIFQRIEKSEPINKSGDLKKMKVIELHFTFNVWHLDRASV